MPPSPEIPHQTQAASDLGLPSGPLLCDLPDHALANVASYSDELTIWRMMATCRTLRHAVEPELEVHLTEQEVLVGNPLVSHSRLIYLTTAVSRPGTC